jgi:predicted amidohydrolase
VWASTLTQQGAEIILCPSFTFSKYGFWRVRHCAQARAIENQVYNEHCATGGRMPPGPLPNGWTRSSVLGHCDTRWLARNGVIAEACTNLQMVLRGTVDLVRLLDSRVTGVPPTIQDRSRRAAFHRGWPSHLDEAGQQRGRVRVVK